MHTLLIVVAMAMPPTPAGAAMTIFLADFNAGKRAADPVFGAWFALYGPLRFQEVATSEPYDLRVWTKSDVTETWVSVRVIVRAEPPHDLRDVRIGTGLQPLAVPRPPPMALDVAMANIDAYFHRLAGADAFSGAVLIARGGAPLYEKAFGRASKRYGVANDVETKFNIASITKLITAFAVLQLADAGKLSLADPLRKFVLSYPSEATVEQLLTHAAGLPKSRFQREAFIDRFARSVAEQVPLTLENRDDRPARYSNEGFLLLGAIIERASGERYDDYVARHIYAPAGMTSSGTFEGDRDVPNLATGYTRWRMNRESEVVFEPGERRNTTFMSALRGNPTGGTYSTVRDLARLIQAIESCKVVTCASRDAIFAQHVALPKEPWAGVARGYGYGVETKSVDGVAYAGKAGDLAGASAQLSVDRRAGVTVIILSNYDAIAQPAAEYVEETLRRARDILIPLEK